MDFDLGTCMIKVLWVAFCHNFFFFVVGFVTGTLLVWAVGYGCDYFPTLS